MSARSRIAAALAGLLASTIHTHARADEPPCATRIEPGAIPEATKLAKRAKEAVLAGRHEEALHLYRSAYCMLPEPTLKHGVSVAAFNLGRCEEALEAARLWNTGADPEDREEARGWLADVEAHCVPVSISSTPAGALLLLDGATHPTGSTPWSGLLRSGAHRLSLTKDDFRPVDEKVAVPDGARKESFAINEVLSPVLPPPVPGRAAGRSSIPSWSPWVPAVVAVAGAALAIGEGVVATQCAPSALPFAGASSCGSNVTTANAGWGIAGAGAATAGILWVLIAVHQPPAATPPSIGVSFLGNGAQLAGSF
jgi:hypothetical protein